MVNISGIFGVPPLLQNTFISTTSALPYYIDGNNDNDNDKCEPYKYTNTSQEACEYVKHFADACESGGYLLWTQYIICTENDLTRICLIILSIFCLFFLFLTMTTTADNFFCCSISTIVDHLKISQSLAGITLMAFGNGANDIFSTIASVLNTKQPKVGLAFGDILGGGAFVTTIVLASVIITKPFKVAKLPTLRDLIFYIIGIAWMAFIMLYDSKLFVWQPAAYLGIYVLYVAIVICGRFYEKIKRKSEIRTREQPPRISISFNDHCPSNESGGAAETNGNTTRRESINSHNMDNDGGSTKFNFHTSVILKPMNSSFSVPPTQRSSNFVIPSIVISPITTALDDGIHERFKYMNGKFHYSEKEIDYDSDDESVIVVTPAAHSGRRFTILSIADARSLMKAEPVINVNEPVTIKRVALDLLDALNPIETNYHKSRWISKAFQIIKCPVIVVLRLTVPLANIWCKSLSMIHCLTMPLTILACFNLSSITIINGGPGLWIYSLIPALIMMLIILFLTSYNIEPSYYKNISGYFGFIMSVTWIYVVSSEVVNIIVMISVISRISHEVLGLTVLTWCNNIGDLVADTFVAKQGFPQMAAAAAIGGPLFNLLFGFGAAFFIATLQGKHVDVSIDGTKATMLIMDLTLKDIELLKDFRNLQTIRFINVGIFYNGYKVSVETIVDCFPNVESFYLKSDTLVFSKNTAQNLANLKRNIRFQDFILCEVTYQFVAEDFCFFIKNQMADYGTVKIIFKPFSGYDDYEEKFEEIVNDFLYNGENYNAYYTTTPHFRTL